MSRLRPGVLIVLAGLLSSVGCGGSGPPQAPLTAAEAADGGLLAVSEPLDQSPFCVAVRGMEELSAQVAPVDASVEDVLTQNARLAQLVDAAAVDTPDDAPAAVVALLADYRSLSDAVAAAEGDTLAAFAALDASDPQLAKRLQLPDAYHEAIAFFADRCGTARQE